MVPHRFILSHSMTGHHLYGKNCIFEPRVIRISRVRSQAGKAKMLKKHQNSRLFRIGNFDSWFSFFCHHHSLNAMALNFSVLVYNNLNIFWGKIGCHWLLCFRDISCQSSESFFLATRYIKFMAVIPHGFFALEWRHFPSAQQNNDIYGILKENTVAVFRWRKNILPLAYGIFKAFSLSDQFKYSIGWITPVWYFPWSC